MRSIGVNYMALLVVIKYMEFYENQKIGRWTLIKPGVPKLYGNGKNSKPEKMKTWICQCSCGNQKTVTEKSLKSGHSNSCGCLETEMIRKSKNDLTGKHIGRLQIIKRMPNGYNGKHQVQYLCICDCGKEVVKSYNSIVRTQYPSCGCYAKEIISKKVKKDISWQRFGKLIALYPVQSEGESRWFCRCDCGNTVCVTIGALSSGNTKSCGCEVSYGEYLVSKILTKNNIRYTRQKSFSDCIFPQTQRKLRFDFWVDNSYIIEFDGRQHFYFTNEEWNTRDNYISTIEHDKYKNEYCMEHNIPIIRIPYTKMPTLCVDDLILETSKYCLDNGNYNETEKTE